MIDQPSLFTVIVLFLFLFFNLVVDRYLKVIFDLFIDLVVDHRGYAGVV